MKFRHGASSKPLEECMWCIHEVNSIEDIKQLHKKEGYTPFDRAHHSEWYAYDKRIGWDTWIVLDKEGHYVGFTNGEVK